MKVGGIACYGCNLLVLMEEQMALTPGNNIIDDQNSLESTVVSTSSQTPFVMGCQLVTNFVLCRMDSRSVCIVCVHACGILLKVCHNTLIFCAVGYILLLLFSIFYTRYYRAHT